MAGPVYYSDNFKNGAYRLPEYYNGKLFIYEWIRHWIMAVTLDADGNYVSMEPFLPQLNVVAPIDMQFASDGAIYLLAYGTNWFARNTDAGLIRVEYTEGNRNPIADIRVDKRYGGLPMTVQLSAAQSKDYDGDPLSYEWKIGTVRKKGISVKHTFTQPGVHAVSLTVSDPHGGKGSSSIQVKAGNTPPQVAIRTTANRTFYEDGAKLDYEVVVRDAEDTKIAPARTRVSFHYLPFGKDMASVLSAGESAAHAGGQKRFLSLDCKSCHAVNAKSIGPHLTEIALRYHGKDARESLVDKIIGGGSGSWGTYPMPPHPTLPRAEAGEIVDYILALAEKPVSLPLKGSLSLNRHQGREGAYLLQATYKDGGARGIEALTSSDRIILRDPQFEMEDYAEGNVGVTIATKNTGFVSYIRGLTDGRYVRFNGFDLSGIRLITFRVLEQGAGGTIEVRTGSKTGPVIGSATIAAGRSDTWKEISATLTPTTGTHDLYFLFRNPDHVNQPLFYVDWGRMGK